MTFAAGQVPAVVQIPIVLDGDIRTWPFDHYDVAFAVGAFAGTPDSSRALDVTATMTGRVQGWKLTYGSTSTLGLDGGTFTFGTAGLRRSGDTLVFAAILLGVLVMLPVLAGLVAARTYFGHRPVQPTFLSWMGAMLFVNHPPAQLLARLAPAWVVGRRPSRAVGDRRAGRRPRVVRAGVAPADLTATAPDVRPW